MGEINRIRCSVLTPTYIEATNIEDAWFQGLSQILKKGNIYKNDLGSFVGLKRKELDYVTLHIQHPATRPLHILNSPLLFNSPCSSSDPIEQYFIDLLDSKKELNQDYTYGTYISAQIYTLIDKLKKYPNTNQTYITIGSFTDNRLKHPPCLRGIDCKIKNNKLHFVIYFRSWDVWGALVINLGGLQLLKEWMAFEIGVEDGEIIAASKGLHLYEYNWEEAKKYINQGKDD